LKVYSLSGSEVWFLVHVEVQGSGDRNLAERLFRYNYRIFERYNRKAVTLLVLSDENPAYHPHYYSETFHGMYVEFRYPYVKLLDYRKKRDFLRKHSNPFALAVEAFLQYIDNKGHTDNLYNAKKELLVLLFRSGYTKYRVQALLKFIDWIIRLPDRLEAKLEDEIQEERGVKPMAYVTSWERMAEKRGIEQGIQKGELIDKQQVLIRQTDRKFGLAGEEKDRIGSCKDAGKLDAALDCILSAESKDEVLGLLD